MPPLFENAAFLIIIGIIAFVFLGLNLFTALVVLRERKNKVDELLNRDQQAMDELHRRVEKLKK
ncbi:MAG: hypothetical protein HFACDABA_01508 [Anaerolineales bacterium]|nr:hypothetical protein [Anaerolineales bacterium]